MKLFKNKIISLNLTLLLLIVVSFSVINCNSDFSQSDDISSLSFSFMDQNNKKINFPGDFKGKIIVMGFIYTNCPDICPMITRNMELVQKKLKQEDIKNVQFISLTFDPERDSASVLKKYAAVRNLDLSNWELLTGNKQETDSLLKRMDVLAIKGDTTYTDDGKIVYFMTHTDRITLIDPRGIIREKYSGSRLDKDVLVNDIKSLGD